MPNFYNDSEESLSKHYFIGLDNRSDFRNWNLFNLVSTMVSGPKVLDIGSGSGGFLKVMQSKGAEVFGLEPNDELVALSQQNANSLNIRKGFAEDLENIFVEKFDSITMLDVLEHIENDSSILERISGKLNPSGQLVLVVPAHQWLFGKRDIKYGHYRRYSKVGLTKLLESRGFVVQKIRYWNMIGVLPYFVSEKIFKKELELKSRGKEGGFLPVLIRSILNRWIKVVENHINFGFGLSLICVANKK